MTVRFFLAFLWYCETGTEDDEANKLADGWTMRLGRLGALDGTAVKYLTIKGSRDGHPQKLNADKYAPLMLL